VKPTRPDLVSNLVVNTEGVHISLRLRSAEKTYMASVSWQYSADQLISLRRQNANAEAATPIITGVDISRLRFRYAIEATTHHGVASAFDDGAKAYIEMPSGIAREKAPPLFCHRAGRRWQSSLRRAAEFTTSLIGCLPRRASQGVSTSRQFASADRGRAR